MSSVLRRIINKFVEILIRKCRETFSTKPQIDAKKKTTTQARLYLLILILEQLCITRVLSIRVSLILRCKIDATT